MAFCSMINQEIGWFDLPENSTGALCSKLASDAANVQGVNESINSNIKSFLIIR